MVYPLPAVMVSCGDSEGTANILTVAWTGTICTNPPMVYISVKPERFSHHIIESSGEFVINLTTERLAGATDLCGVKSGRDTDKWAECGLTKGKASSLEYAPVISECPVNIECRVAEIKHLGSHDMFIANVVGVQVDEEYFDESGKFHLNESGIICYSHGEYFALGEKLGSFGYSVKKEPVKKEYAEKRHAKNEPAKAERALERHAGKECEKAERAPESRAKAKYANEEYGAYKRGGSERKEDKLTKAGKRGEGRNGRRENDNGRKRDRKKDRKNDRKG